MDGDGGYGVSGDQWLKLAEKLLEARDFNGARSFASKAGDADGSLRGIVDQITAITQTLAAGDLRINGKKDLYAILQVSRLSKSHRLITSQYRNLYILLNPERNRLPLAEEGFRLVSDAWQILSDSEKKGSYDRELEESQNNHHPQENSSFDFSNRKTRQSKTSSSDAFWTTCPYCLTMHEYPGEYEDCALRCQSCKRTIHGVKVPPPTMIGEHSYLVSKSPFPDQVRNDCSSFPPRNGFGAKCNESNGRKKEKESDPKEGNVNGVEFTDVLDDLDEILNSMPI